MTSHSDARHRVGSSDGVGQQPFGEVLDRNISTLVEMRRSAERRRGLQERAADTITCFTGSMLFVYLHALFFGGWIVLNLGLLPLQPFDPSFVTLAMVASVEAIFLSTFVLISQNRMQAAADKRAELDLQVSLLAEHEITKLVELTDAIAEHLGMGRGEDPDVEESKQHVNPAAVLDAIEDREEESSAATGEERGGRSMDGGARPHDRCDEDAA